MRGNPKRYIRYPQVQANYLEWCREQAVDGMDPSGASIVNFLAHGHENHKWKINTLETYRSSIVDMFENRQEIKDSYAHRAFFQAVNDQTLRREQDRPVDISPIIQHFQKLGSNHTTLLPDLTAKLC